MASPRLAAKGQKGISRRKRRAATSPLAVCPPDGRRAAGIGQAEARARRQRAWGMAAGVSPWGRLRSVGAGVGVGAGRRLATPGQRRAIPAVGNGRHFADALLESSEWRTVCGAAGRRMAAASTSLKVCSCIRPAGSAGAPVGGSGRHGHSRFYTTVAAGGIARNGHYLADTVDGIGVFL